jgi:leucyl aminopeptidase (aminopeptidase T)
MNKMKKMINAAREAFSHVLKLGSDEKVLVVTDERRKSIGGAFYQAAREIGASAELFLLPEDQRPLKEPPSEMASLLEDKNVVINSFFSLAEETPFRIRWIREIMETKTRRLGHAPGITEEMMTEGPMNVDYKVMLEKVRRMMEKLKGAKEAHLVAPGGTDITLNIKGRDFATDVEIPVGRWGNLPAGEIWCGPIEDGADGVIVCDGSIGDLGQVKKPLKILVEKGKIKGLDSEDKDLVKKIEELSSVDEMASVTGELGIGLNPKARITGNLLEDEKALRTAHIAFGNNQDMPGGKNRSRTHRDYLLNRPTLTVTYLDGTKKVLIKDGELDIQ